MTTINDIFAFKNIDTRNPPEGLTIDHMRRIFALNGNSLEDSGISDLKSIWDIYCKYTWPHQWVREHQSEYTQFVTELRDLL